MGGPGNTTPSPVMGYVYFLTDEAAIKIGWSGSPPERAKTLQVGNHKPLRIMASIPGTADDEAIAHERFSHLRVRGEWFRYVPELLDFIAHVQKQGRFELRHPLELEVLQVRREIAAWAKGKAGYTVMLCNSFRNLLNCALEHPEYPETIGCLAMCIESLEATLAHERKCKAA